MIVWVPVLLSRIVLTVPKAIEGLSVKFPKRPIVPLTVSDAAYPLKFKLPIHPDIFDAVVLGIELIFKALFSAELALLSRTPL